MTTNRRHNAACYQPLFDSTMPDSFKEGSRTQSARRSLLVSSPARVVQYVAVPSQHQSSTCLYALSTCLYDR